MASKSNLLELRERNIANQRAAAEAAEENTDAPNEEAVDRITSNMISPSYDLLTDGHGDIPDDRPIGPLSGPLADRPGNRPAGKAARRTADKTDVRSEGRSSSLSPEVRSRLKQISGTTMIPVTLKVPSGINEYIDEHIHDQWKEKIKKQDILKRALLLAIYEIETGTQLLNLDA